MGEIVVDMITNEKSLNKFTRFFGGSPANVAIHLANKGNEVFFAGTIGNDFLGEYLKQILTNNNVNTSLLQRSSKPTSVIIIDEDYDSPIPLFYKSADPYYYFTDELKEKIKYVDLIHVSAHALSMAPLSQTVLETIKLGLELQKIISLEPNFRSKINLEDKTYQKTVLNVLKYIDIVKPSLDDAHNLFDENLDTFEIIAKFFELGVKRLVILTCGSKGVYFCSKDGDPEYLPVHPIKKVAGVTGAGDAFWGGFLSSYIKEFNIKKAIQAGMETASEKIRHIGAVR